MKKLILILNIFISINSLCQNYYSDSFLDSVIEPLGNCKNKSLREIAAVLKINSKDDLLQYSVISKWVVNNFYYSIDAKGKDISYSLNVRKAVCYQYAAIVDSLSKYCDLESEFINGFAKAANIKKAYGLEWHSWNSIKINGKIYLSDITWCDLEVGKKNKLNDKLSKIYFLVEPKKFIIDHFPDNKHHKYTDYSWRKFKNNPFFYDGIYDVFEFYFSNKNKLKLFTKLKNIEITFDESITISDFQIQGMTIELLKNDGKENGEVGEIYHFFKKTENGKIVFYLNIDKKIKSQYGAIIYFELVDKNDEIVGSPLLKLFII